MLILGSALGATWLGTVAWPLVVTVAGLVLLWRNAPEGEQALLRRFTDPLLGLAGGGSRTGSRSAYCRRGPDQRRDEPGAHRAPG